MTQLFPATKWGGDLGTDSIRPHMRFQSGRAFSETAVKAMMTFCINHEDKM